MKKYRVNVNGTNYEIELEAMSEGDINKTAAAVSAPTPAPAAAPAAAPIANATKVKSPMPGTIMSVSIAQGENVKKGQVLMVLEAMKMENEIMSPADGRIVLLNVTSGATVDTGTLLCMIG